MATVTELKLMEKIVRAKVKLEGAKRNHASSCMVDADPDYMGPCKCGAGDANTAIDAALSELEIK